MKIHHIGIVAKEKIFQIFYISQKKYTYFDKVQNNKIILESMVLISYGWNLLYH